MNNTISQDIQVFHEFALSNAHKRNIHRLHIYCVAFISSFCRWLVMPEIAVKLDDQIKRRDISVYNKFTYAVLSYIIQPHNFNQLIADNFKGSRSRTLFSAIMATIFGPLVVMRGFNPAFLPTISTNDSNPYSCSVFTDACVRTEVTNGGTMYTSSGFINFFSTIKALYNFTGFPWFVSLLAGMLGGAFSRAKVTLAGAYQVWLLVKFLPAMIAVHTLASPFRVIFSLPVSIMTWLAAIEARCIGVAISLKCFLAMFAYKSLFFHGIIITDEVAF